MSPSTSRLLKVVLTEACLWTSLRDVEGFDYGQTLNELKLLYAPDSHKNDDDDDDDRSYIPDAIREMLGCKSTIEALGNMMW